MKIWAYRLCKMHKLGVKYHKVMRCLEITLVLWNIIICFGKAEGDE
jgi:hypothetical protein